MVLLDPYANSFQANDINFSPNAGDDTRVVSYLGTTVSAMNRKIFERKFEIDSLCAFLKVGFCFVVLLFSSFFWITARKRVLCSNKQCESVCGERGMGQGENTK